ncbi:zinc finger, C2H2 type [Cooperia oncophora]
MQKPIKTSITRNQEEHFCFLWQCYEQLRLCELSAVQQPRVPPNPFSNGLGALFQFVGKLHGESMLNAPQRRDTEVDSILKCLQCGRTFQTMEMLVRHMQDTQHFNNLPKTYSSLIQMDRQKVLNLKLQMKSDGVKLACVKCGEIPTNIDKHLKEVHDVKTSSDWLKNIRIVRDGGQLRRMLIGNFLHYGSLFHIESGFATASLNACAGQFAPSQQTDVTN